MTPAATQTTAPPAWTASRPFVPRRGLGNGHLMTLFAWAAQRRFALPAPERRLIRVSDDTQVLAHCYWQDATRGPADASGAARPRGVE